MIASRHMTKIVAILMAAAVALCLCATLVAPQIVSAAGGLGVTMEYESKLFDTSEVLEINILMDDADWQAMLDNAMSEEYVQCDVQVAGQTFYRVGIRPKGNTSLSSIANDPDTDRYSFKLEFDQFVDGQTCYGLDKLILNNNYADATNMKEALIYDMFAYVGADASLYNYAKVSVNGEYWGVYLALEAVEDSFMLRNYGTENGELYKPDSMNMGGSGGDRGNRGEMPDMGNMDFGGMDFSNMQPPTSGGNTDAEQTPDGNAPTAEPDTQTPSTDMQPGNFQRPDGGEMPDMGDFDPSEMFGGGGFGGMGGMFGGGGSNLNYSDDDPDSYSTIWDGEVTNTGDGDHKRVVTALKNISEGTNLEKYMDTDNLLRYAAVHIFSINSDSLSGSMAHNYYLYESDGQLNILPWDYNLAFGGMGGGMGGGMSGGATDTVNSAIDDAWSSTNFFDTLMADEEYHTAYYEYMAQVVDYIQNGGFEAFYTRTRNMIDTLVETDPNAFYPYDEYLTAVETLYEFVTLRGQSIQGQLNGSIPSTESAQRSSDALIDASHLDLSDLGSMSMGGGAGGKGERDFSFKSNRSTQEIPAAAPTAADTPTIGTVSLLSFNAAPETPASDRSTSAQIGSGQDRTQFGGQMPDGMDFSQFSGQMPGGTVSSQPDDQTSDETDSSRSDIQIPEGFDSSQFSGQLPDDMDISQFAGQMPGGFGQFGETSGETQDGSQNTQTQTRPTTGSMFDMNFGGQSGSPTNAWLLYGISAAVMLAAFLFALFYRRRPRKR